MVFACLPGVLLLGAATWGGGWIWAALIWMGGASQAVDGAIARAFADPNGQSAPGGANALSVALALLHFLLMALGLRALVAGGLGAAQGLALFLALGLFFGQVSNANAHELIHRPSRLLFRLGAAVYVSLLFGHHTSAHRLVHHRHVATPADPNSARLGEGFWRFFPRAWIGSFHKGLRAENARMARRPRWRHPYLAWVGGGAAVALAVALTLGARGLACWLGLCLYAQMQLLLSDYVQHYGLLRERIGNGYEPAGSRHSWDAPHFLSSLMMVNAPRHSDHHANPMRPFPDLRLNRESDPRPMLPYSLPVMAAIATIPPLWRRVMDRRVARMRAN